MAEVVVGRRGGAGRPFIGELRRRDADGGRRAVMRRHGAVRHWQGVNDDGGVVGEASTGDAMPQAGGDRAQAALFRGRRRCAASTAVGRWRGVCGRAGRGVAACEWARGGGLEQACSRALARGPAAVVRRGRRGSACRAPCARAHGQSGAACVHAAERVLRAWPAEQEAAGVVRARGRRAGAGRAERLRSRGRGGGTPVRAALGSGAERGVARSGRAGEEEGRRERKGEKEKGRKKWKREK